MKHTIKDENGIKILMISFKNANDLTYRGTASEIRDDIIYFFLKERSENNKEEVKFPKNKVGLDFGELEISLEFAKEFFNHDCLKKYYHLFVFKNMSTATEEFIQKSL